VVAADDGELLDDDEATLFLFGVLLPLLPVVDCGPLTKTMSSVLLLEEEEAFGGIYPRLID